MEVTSCTWAQDMTVEELVTMSCSSTQAQRAIARGPEFLDRLRALCATYARDGRISIGYVSEAYAGITAA